MNNLGKLPIARVEEQQDRLGLRMAQYRVARSSGLFLVNMLFTVFALCLAVPMLSVAQAQSQPEILIKTSEADLEAEYRDELDKWMLRAYEGDPDAQFKVGVLFTNDQFGPPDFEQAVYWYTQSARQGNVLAQYNLGHQYLTGVGVAKSEESAMKWWLLAADQDHALAQFNIGRAYYLGIGLNEDHEQSKYWFERAAANQEPKSIDILKQLGWNDSSQLAGATPPANNTAAVDDINSDAGLDGAQSGAQLTSKIVPIKAVNLPADTETTTQEAAQQTQTEPEPGPTPLDASNEPESASPEVTNPDVVQKNPLALYTDPAVRSVLIAILDERDGITELDRGTEWATVQSEFGFPVWVHSDFLTASGASGKVTGQAVNARSVPIITNGTVVGRLNKDEEVEILSQRKSWYRISAPKRFKAWVKINELDQQPTVINAGQDANPPVIEQSEAAVETPAVAASQQAPSLADASDEERSINENNWLFSQPRENYTLQLASFDDPAKSREFENRSKFLDNPNLHRFTATGKNIEWTYFLYGSYSNRDTAEAAKLSIEQKLAWVRTFDRLQQNRCLAWKTQLPTPAELNRYCTQ